MTPAASTTPARSSGAVIETVGASRWYGEVIAVRDVTLSIPPGVVGLLGPNGAGKSTLLRMLVGQLRPSRGEVRIFGETLADNPRLLRRLGYCPEHEGAWDELTGLELVSLLGELHGLSRADSKTSARAMLERLDLGAALDRRVGEYSKGMRQRAKVAQALAHDPELVFLDEPFNGCDPLARQHVLEVLVERAARGVSLVVSSHVLHEIEAMTSQILLIHRGQLVAEGDVHRLRELIDRHPHQVRLESTRPRELGRELIGAPHVTSLRFDGDVLVVETREPDKLYPAIPEAARAADARILSLSSPDDNLAAVFKYLTEPSAAEAGR